MKRALFTTALAIVGPLALGACRGQTSADPPIVPIRNMHRQQRYNPQSESYQFSDRRTQRPLVEGTVARESYIEDDRVALGREADNSAYVATIPEEVVTAAHGMEHLVARGRDRYTIYCTACHGGLGDGNGIVPVRATTTGGYQFPAPPTFHQPRIQHMPDGQMFATITNGVRNMAAYGPQIPVPDRWAIVAYVRALQLSQAGSQPPAAAAAPAAADPAAAQPSSPTTNPAGATQ